VVVAWALREGGPPCGFRLNQLQLLCGTQGPRPQEYGWIGRVPTAVVSSGAGALCPPHGLRLLDPGAVERQAEVPQRKKTSPRLPVRPISRSRAGYGAPAPGNWLVSPSVDPIGSPGAVATVSSTRPVRGLIRMPGRGLLIWLRTSYSKGRRSPRLPG
jgi:hypothetical protein